VRGRFGPNHSVEVATGRIASMRSVAVYAWMWCGLVEIASLNLLSAAA
jgi:hypothetical protein